MDIIYLMMIIVNNFMEEFKLKFIWISGIKKLIKNIFFYLILKI